MPPPAAGAASAGGTGLPDAAPETAPAAAMTGSGVGFGTRVLPGISNCLRVLTFEEAAQAPGTRELAVIEFEIDTQAGQGTSITVTKWCR